MVGVGERAAALRDRRRLAAGLFAAAAGVLLLGVSGAVTALGDTLFPVATLAEGETMTFSESAHLFVRLRIYHPLLALAVGAGVMLAAVSAARRTPQPIVRRLGAAVVLLWIVQLLLGVLNVYLLAPIPVQMLHLLLSDLIWIALGPAHRGGAGRQRRASDVAAASATAAMRQRCPEVTRTAEGSGDCQAELERHVEPCAAWA